MWDGFVRVAAGTPEIHVADCKFNAEQVIALMKEAEDQNVMILVLPELCLTGYTAQDLLPQETLLQGALDALEMIRVASRGSYLVTVVGLPIFERGQLYNCAAVVQERRILGIVPKRNLPNSGVSYEMRHFTPGFDEVRRLKLPLSETPFGIDSSVGDDNFFMLKLPIENETLFGGNLIFECEELPELRLAVEIAEDLWALDTPSAHHALAGATVIANPSAVSESVGMAGRRRLTVMEHSARLACAYLYAEAGQGESTQDLVFSGQNLLCENGRLLKESERYTTGLIISEIDVKFIEYERRRRSTFALRDAGYTRVPFHLTRMETPLSRRFAPLPFVPEDEKERARRCEDILNIQAQGLMQRLRHTHCRTAVIGVSGGLDSTLALLVTERAFRLLGLPTEGILAVTMPCFGTTQRTRSNAEVLAECLGLSFREVNIAAAVRQHFEDIGQSMDCHDVTFENGQARERTQVLMDIANQCGGMVIGTGDLSELALGWATYNGDHMSMYGVNASVPKTLVRYLVRHVAEGAEAQALHDVLMDILDTPVSPELLPPVDGDIAQKTEDLVGPYELHDFYLYHALRRGCAPEKIRRMAQETFHGRYDEETIVKWLRIFFRRFFNQQFKRSCLPDGPRVGSVGVSPRGDLRMPSDASSALWQQF